MGEWEMIWMICFLLVDINSILGVVESGGEDME